jgi:hypothetical protein
MPQIDRILRGSRSALEAMYLPLICRQHAQQPTQKHVRNGGLAGSLKHTSNPLDSSSETGSGRETRSQNVSNSSRENACVLGDLARIRAISQLEQQPRLASGVLKGGKEEGALDVLWEQHAGLETQGDLFRQLPPALLTRVGLACIRCLQEVRAWNVLSQGARVLVLW